MNKFSQFCAIMIRWWPLNQGTYKNINEQESIPVGCVPPACADHTSLSSKVPCPGGPITGNAYMGLPPGWQTDKLTDTYENITFSPLARGKYKWCTHPESNFGRQMGVHDSAALKDSDAETRLNIKWRSSGCRKYFFIRTIVTSWLFATSIANTRSCRQGGKKTLNWDLNHSWDLLKVFVERQL